MAIRKVVDREKWHFVKGKINPADIPTRLASNLVESLSGCWCWFEVPQMLWGTNSEWISSSGSVDENSLVGSVRLEASTEVANFSIPTDRGTPDNNICSISAVIDCTRYSS